MELKEYELVRVRQLLRSPEAYNGWCINLRPPRIGDVGTIVDIFRRPGYPANYVVEATQPDGNTLWLGDFREEELERVEHQGDSSTVEPGR